MSFLNNYMINLYEAGILSDKGEEMAKITSLYKDYTIEFSRKELHFVNENTRWIGNGAAEYSVQFLCKFLIKNNFNLPVLEINTSEIDIYKILDNLYQIYNHLLNEVLIPIDSINEKYKKYLFEFKRIEKDLVEFNIYEKNIQNGITMMRIKIIFDNKIFEDFTNIIYFIFLIDIDDSSNNEIYNLIY